MFKGYIYRHWIVNDKGEEKSYIGQVYNRTPEQRWKSDGKGYITGKQDHKFTRAIKKYGWDNFNHEIIGIVEADTKEQLILDLDEWEKYYIDKYDSFHNGYNSTTGGGNGFRSEETRQKISDGLKGKSKTEEHIKHMSEGLKGRKSWTKGKHHSEETKHKISESLKGRERSDDFKQKISNVTKNEKNPRAKTIICLNTQQIFLTVKNAVEWCHGQQSDISRCCQGKLKSAGKHPITGEKLQWMYYDEYLEQQNNDKSDSKIA